MEKGFIKDIVLPILKATILSVIVSLVMVLIFALVVKLTAFSSVGVKVVNQFIKVASLFLGCFFFLRDDKGLIKGGVTGLLYSFIVNVVFGMISGNGITIGILEILYMVIVGAILGIVCVNLKNKA